MKIDQLMNVSRLISIYFSRKKTVKGGWAVVLARIFSIVLLRG